MLSYYPKQGEVLLCDFSEGFEPPEMTKRRPVIIVSPRLRHRKSLVTVVPLSTTEPRNIEAYHVAIHFAQPLSPKFDALDAWAKCDMIATVALARLDRFKHGRKPNSYKRLYKSGQLTTEQLRAVQGGVSAALGFLHIELPRF